MKNGLRVVFVTTALLIFSITRFVKFEIVSQSDPISLTRKARTKYSSETHFFFFGVLQMLLTNVAKSLGLSQLVQGGAGVAGRSSMCVGGKIVSSLIVYPLTK